MRLGKSIDTYVQLVERACKTTWQHKEWWIVAAFAGLANTGGVFSSVFNTFWRLRPADTITAQTISDVFPVIDWFLAYIRNLIALQTGDRLISLALFTLTVALAILVTVACQHLLLNAIKKGHGKTQPFSLSTFKKDLSHIHIARLFAVNAFFFLILSLIVTGSSIPLSLLLTDDVSINLFLYAGIYAIILPLAFVANILGMLTLIYISQHNLSLIGALKEGMVLVQKHWLGALELSVVLFFINLIASLAYFFVLFLTTVVIGLLFEIAFVANAYFVMALITFLGILLAGAITLIYAGAITMLSYTLWSNFAQRIRRRRHTPVVEHMVRLAQKALSR